MKSKLALCSFVLGCSMGLMAQQTSSSPGATPGTSTPPTFPQDQSQQQTAPDHQVGSQPGMPTSTQPGVPANTPDAQDQTGQTGSSTSSQSGQMDNSGKSQKIEGCLSGTDGNFTLADKSGMTYQLQGSNSDLAKHVGQEVRVEGTASAAGSSASSSSSSSEASSSNPSSSSSPANTFTVTKVKKVSDSCSSGSGSSASPKQ